MTLTRAWAQARPGRRFGALVAGLSLLLSGCYTATAQSHQTASPDTRPYFCNAVGQGTPIGGHGNGNHVHPIYEGMTKGELSWEDCVHLSNQFDEVLAAMEGLETRSAGEAAEWREVGEYIPGLGTHHAKGFPELPPDFDPTDPNFELPEGFEPPDMTFDPAKPAFIIYGGPDADAPLVGVAYALPGGQNPPEAFAGTNDWWHLHTKICFDPETGDILAGAEEIPDEECAALGGVQRSMGSGLWLLHLWIMPDYQLKLDVFASGHPCLGETGPLPWEDPCWDLVGRDPSEGLPPGTGHDDDHGS
jgi:hypothetical protein